MSYPKNPTPGDLHIDNRGLKGVNIRTSWWNPCKSVVGVIALLLLASCGADDLGDVELYEGAELDEEAWLDEALLDEALEDIAAPLPSVAAMNGLPLATPVTSTPELAGVVVAGDQAATELNRRVDTIVSSSALGRIFVGGNFTKTGTGAVRTRLAAIDYASGALDGTFKPSANGLVRGLALSSDSAFVFAGGDFTQVNGAARGHLAKINATTGLLSQWSANTNGKVYAVAVSGDTLYVGGSFSTIKGIARNNLAAVDVATGNVLAFNPKVSGGNVRSIVVAPNGTGVYIGGSFMTVGGLAREHVAVVTAATGNPTAWVPYWGGDAGAIHPVWEIAVVGTRLYAAVGGSGASGGNRCKAYNLGSNTGNNVVWFHGADGDHQAVAASSNYVYCGGHFDYTVQAANTNGNSVTRKKLYLVNAGSGTLVSGWNGGFNSIHGTHAITLTGDAMLVGGDHTLPRQAFQRFNAAP
jgi:hypothetical protein